MPRFSIVVPLYNGASYIESCLQSVLSQGFKDFELICVDDCSSDASVELVSALCQEDSRIVLMRHEKNEGTLIARRDGVLSTSGDYVILIDQDDALAPDALEYIDAALSAAHNPDILHFGALVIADNAEAEAAAEGMKNYVTPRSRYLEGTEILVSQFAEADGFDWNVHHKALRGRVAREAWRRVKEENLSLSDDLYACFVLDSLAQNYVAVEDAEWYEYHLGRGETFGEALNLEGFSNICTRDASAARLVKTFVEENSKDIVRSDWKERISDVCSQLAAHMLNEMQDKILDKDRQTALDMVLECAKDLGAAPLGTHLMRLAHDDAYAAWIKKLPFSSTQHYVEWFHRADTLARTARTHNEIFPASFVSYRSAAQRYILDLEHGSVPIKTSAESICPFRAPSYEAQSIRIFVTTHKNVQLFNSDILQPVQVGTGRPDGRFLWAFQDDVGENISDKNACFCELTTQYWAWKNVQANYVGFCHYRRYFNFSPKEHKENPYGEIIDEFINDETQERYGLCDDQIFETVSNYDILTSRLLNLKAFPEHFANPYDQFDRSAHLHATDLARIMELLAEAHPSYVEDIKTYLEGNRSCFCNMFIMRKEMFNRYCEWLFPLLDRFVSEWDTMLLSHEALRTPGHLAERLFNVFLIHELRLHPELKHKELQCVHFEQPEAASILKIDPIQDVGLPVVPVVLAADNTYVPMVTTTVYSMLKNAAGTSFFDVTILESDITPYNQQVMQRFFARFPNVYLRFLNVSDVMSAYQLQTSNPHISEETYYRFLIQELLPHYDKVLYLDSDLIVQADVTRLFATDVVDSYLAAVIDIDYLGNLNYNDGERLAYTREVLGMENPYGYFQAGVLLLNTAELRKLHTTQEWLEIASNPRYIYDDQDILNAACQGKVVYLDPSWNVMNDCGGRVKKVFCFAPAAVYDAYIAAANSPKIVHFAGFEKPWKPEHCDQEELFWEYARETPFYEVLLRMTRGRDAREIAVKSLKKGKAVVRDTANVVLPPGTQRREIVKKGLKALKLR